MEEKRWCVILCRDWLESLLQNARILQANWGRGGKQQQEQNLSQRGASYFSLSLHRAQVKNIPRVSEWHFLLSSTVAWAVYIKGCVAGVNAKKTGSSANSTWEDFLFVFCIWYWGRGRTLQKYSWYHFQMAPKLDSRHLMKGSSEFLLCFGWMHDRSYRLMLYLAVTERILHSLLSFVSFQPCCMPKPIDWLQLKQLHHRIQRYSTNELYPEKLSCFNKNLVSLTDFHTYPSNIKYVLLAWAHDHYHDQIHSSWVEQNYVLYV